VKEIEIAVRRLLEDTAFKEGAKKLGTVISGNTQDDCAEQLLEEMAADIEADLISSREAVNASHCSSKTKRSF
jgi:hypothetical protein